MARYRGRTRRGPRRSRRDHDAGRATPTSITINRGTPAAEPLAIGGFLPLDSVYAYEPVPAELEPQFAPHILGAQGQVWTEYIEGPKNVEYMAFPRESALAEVLWTPKARRDFADFSARLAAEFARLQALDVNYRPTTKP